MATNTMNLITSLIIDSIVFDNSNYIMTSITGLESPTLRAPHYNLPSQSGAAISNMLYGERNIVIKGVVNAPDNVPVGQKITTYLNNRQALGTAMRYKRDANNNIIPQLMTITLANGTQVSTQVYLDKPIQMGFSTGQVDYEDFQLTFLAPDPNLYSTVQTSTNITLPIGGGFGPLPYNTGSPVGYVLSLAASSGGSATINNSGANIAYPTITLTGPLVDPYIANITTNGLLQLNMTIPNGSSVIINMQTQSVTMGGTDVSSNLTSSSTFWTLAVGLNTIGFSAGSGTGTANVAFYVSYITI